MGTSSQWRLQFNREIENAQNARYSGNEGKARVCARRAAGIVAGEYLLRLHKPVASSSAFQRLKVLQAVADMPLRLIEILEHMTMQVDPDHKLPVKADLIAEAEELRKVLLEN